MKYSIITVSLNPGESLKKTLESIKAQTYSDYEVIIKDGGSTDNSLADVPKDMRFRVVYGSDKGIYDAMNVAVRSAVGDAVLFLNAGDLFYDEHVLEHMADKIEKEHLKPPFIAYGDMFSKRAQTVIKAASKVTPMVCYNYIACHQATLYSIDVLRANPFNIKYKIRADYDLFLDCYFNKKATFYYLDMPVCEYEGGGYSEKKSNRERDQKEHEHIVNRYIPKKVRVLCKLRLLLTFHKLRGVVAKSKVFGGAYEKIRRLFTK